MYTKNIKINYLWNCWKYADGRTCPPVKWGYRNAARLAAASNGLRKLKLNWVNGFGGSAEATTVADGTGVPYGLYGCPCGPTFSCLRHFARRF